MKLVLGYVPRPCPAFIACFTESRESLLSFSREHDVIGKLQKIQSQKSQVLHQVLHIPRAFKNDAGLCTRQLGCESSHRPTCKVDNLSAQTYTTEKSILSCSDSREDSVLAQTVERTQCIYTSSVVCRAPLKAFAQDGQHIQSKTIDNEQTCEFFALWCNLIFIPRLGINV